MWRSSSVLCIHLPYKASQPSMNLVQSSGNEVKSKQKKSEQETLFFWHLLAEKTRSNICFFGALTSVYFPYGCHKGLLFKKKYKWLFISLLLIFAHLQDFAPCVSIHRSPYRTCWKAVWIGMSRIDRDLHLCSMLEEKI